MAKSFADAISMEIRSDVPCRKDFVFTVSPEALRKESARALQRVAMAVNIPGFRRGKAPAALLQSKYAEDIENEVKRMLVYTAYDKIDAADAGEMLNCNLEKDIQINKDADTVFTMVADIAPEFEVGDYKALKVEAAAADVSDEQVEERVNFYRTMYANYAEVTEAAAAGDMLKVNYSSDFPVPEDASASLKRQLQAEDGYVWLSEPEIIPGSMAALTGVVAGDERTFDAVYAEDYREAALAGKTVKYTVKVLTVQRKKDLTDEELCSKTQAPSMDEFRKMIAEDKFVEFEEVYAGSFYGTLKSEVERIWDKGNTIIFDIDVQGGVNLKRIFGEQALSIFIQAPSVEILRERLVGRGTDTQEAIDRRVAKAASEMEFAAGKFDYVLINDDLATAKTEAEKVVGDFLGTKS